MFINKIEEVIDKILDSFIVECKKDTTFKTITEKKTLEYVDHRNKINDFIDKFIKGLDVSEIKKLVVNKDNITKILEIIKRYVTYYYFLSIAYYYQGSLQQFRNNLIQYSNLQLNSTFVVKNFFDTENNYRVIRYYKMVKDIASVLMMTDLQKKTLDINNVKEAITFLNKFPKEVVENFFLMIIKKKDGVDEVQINVHNIIKSIVVIDIYTASDQEFVFNILNETEEKDHEYTYIEIIVPVDDENDYTKFQNLFSSYENGDDMAQSFYELTNQSVKLIQQMSIDEKNNRLLELGFVTPIVDDFIRFHRESEKLISENDASNQIPLVDENVKNINTVLMNQQKKKKETTKAQIIINKLDAISDMYSSNVKNKPDAEKEIKKFFMNPLSHRRAVMYNYLDELKVLNKMINIGRKTIRDDEYFKELEMITRTTYYNFRDIEREGTSIHLNLNKTVDAVRYSNIEFIKQSPKDFIEMRTVIQSKLTSTLSIGSANVVGFCIKPNSRHRIKCDSKSSLISIYDVTLKYPTSKGIKDYKCVNGIQGIKKIIKHFFINTMKIITKPKIGITFDQNEMAKLNKDLFSQTVFWLYNTEKDTYKLDSYENVKTSNVQEKIKMINAKIYDDVITMLERKITDLIAKHIDVPTHDVEKVADMFVSFYGMKMTMEEIMSIIVEHNIMKKKYPDQHKTIDILVLPFYKSYHTETVAKVIVDLKNIFAVKEIKEKKDVSAETKTITCQHEIEFKEVMKLKKGNINEFNMRMTEFNEKFFSQDSKTGLICKICGMVLPSSEYVEDGKFDDETQKFISAYTPTHIPLKEIKEYQGYTNTIKSLKVLVKRLSLITNTNMLTGSSVGNKIRRTAFIKTVIDIIIKHSNYNLQKRQSRDDQTKVFSKRFGIDEKFDILDFFEFNDHIFDSNDIINEAINKIKRNIVLLYIMFIFIIEIISTQVIGMSYDRTLNVYSYEKISSRLFSDLYIKKSINDNEVASLLDYPVLCYLILNMSYLMIKHKLWYDPNIEDGKFNAVGAKIIIHSFLKLVNGILIDASKDTSDYTYMLVLNKFYSQVNKLFRSEDVMKALYNTQSKYSDKKGSEVPTESIPPSFSLTKPIEIKPKAFYSKPLRVTFGQPYYNLGALHYNQLGLSSLVLCPTGRFHKWFSKSGEFICEWCGEKMAESKNITREEEAFYYILNEIASIHRCISGELHDFIEKDGKWICKLCQKEKGISYQKTDLDKLMINLDNRKEKINARQKDITEEKEQKQPTASYGQVFKVIDGFVDGLEKIVGKGISSSGQPMIYFKSNSYVIDHDYKGMPFTKPFIFTDDDNRIILKQNHPFFKRDVYYYVDTRSSQIEVYYDAITLELIGHHEKHKDYVENDSIGKYIVVNQSIKNRLLNMTFESRYIDVTKMIEQENSENNAVLDSLIIEHVHQTKSSITKIISILIGVFNVTEITKDKTFKSQTVEKYSKLIDELKISIPQDAFIEWNKMRTSIDYVLVNWKETDVVIDSNHRINTDAINRYDISSSILIEYFCNQFNEILKANDNNASKITLIELLVDIVNYIYSSNNIEVFKNMIDYKRYMYGLESTSMSVDLTQKGHGLDGEDIDESDKLDEEEADYAKEESEALDIEGDYFHEEDPDAVEED